MQIISPNGYRTIEQTLSKKVYDIDELEENPPDFVTNAKTSFFGLLEKYGLPKPNIVYSSLNQCDCTEIETHFSKRNELLYMLKSIFQPEPNEEGKILPHEYGHWVMNGFELYKREDFYIAFGDYDLPVNDDDGIKFGGDSVFLKAFNDIKGPEREIYENNLVTLYEYMQKPIHPEESFSETMALVLEFGPKLKEHYVHNPIIFRKIEYVKSIIKCISGKQPLVSDPAKLDGYNNPAKLDGYNSDRDSLYEHLMKRRKLFFEPIDSKLFRENTPPEFLKKICAMEQKVLEMRLI
ncbi:hypothetical protein J4409_00880 [Candidatus Woesearchaeota archaeon]|nr:hypothetical protein [Candidatus Woesearchaeota archaeon]